jgi:predicted protein tyrosine phosphatase
MAAPPKKVLFVCTQNRFRSVTAEHLYRSRTDLEVRSAGVAAGAKMPLTAELLGWADVVFVFEKRQRNIIHKRFPELYAAKTIHCLYVPDEFDYMSPALVVLLEERLERYLGKANNDNPSV